MCTYALDTPVNLMNDQIDSGMLSSDTTEHMQTIMWLWKTSPIIFLLGLILFVYERGKGTSLPASLFFEYEVLLMLGLMVSVYMTWAYGTTADLLFSQFEKTEVIANISPEWESTKLKVAMLKMMYVACLTPGFLASLLFVLHPVLRQTDNTYSFIGSSEDEDGSSDTGEYVTPYSPQQFQ